MATITPDYFKNFHKFGERLSGRAGRAVGSCTAPQALQRRRQAPAVCAWGRKAGCVGRTPPARPAPTSAPPPNVQFHQAWTGSRASMCAGTSTASSCTRCGLGESAAVRTAHFAQRKHSATAVNAAAAAAKLPRTRQPEAWPSCALPWQYPSALLLQINKEALRAQTNSTGYTTFERLIPVEAMFIVSGTECSGAGFGCTRGQLAWPAVCMQRIAWGLHTWRCGCSPLAWIAHCHACQPPSPVPPAQIFNFAMSNSFTSVDFDRLQFPAQYKVRADGAVCYVPPMLLPWNAFSTCQARPIWLHVSLRTGFSTPQIDYVRLYQDPAAINLGCSPPDMPTEQYIAWCAAGANLAWLAGKQPQAVDWHARQGEHATLVYAACSRSHGMSSTHTGPLLTPLLCLLSCAATATRTLSPPTTRRWCRSPATACPGTLAGLGPFARSNRARHCSKQHAHFAMHATAASRRAAHLMYLRCPALQLPRGGGLRVPWRRPDWLQRPARQV